MEKSAPSHTNELLMESNKIANKWINDASASMLEIYNKQMNIVSGFYNNLFRALPGTSSMGANYFFNPSNWFPNLFTGSNDSMRSFFAPFTGFSSNGGFTNPFLPSYNNFFSQAMEFNRNLMNIANREFHGEKFDWKSFNEHYKNYLETEFEATKHLFDTLSESYRKRMKFSFDFNKDFLEESVNQLNASIRQNQKFWEEAFKLYQPQIKEARKNGEEKNTGVKSKTTENVYN